ncbi:hypothetical protein ACN47A_04640 [Myxococcus fulvus]|uniref:hypothetical protein n=1 Tax=Myxococcus fulvus TaxID=33 RepID=UPI003B9B80B8
MSERIRAASAVLSAPPASEGDLRLRREGRVEFLEVARYRDAPLVGAPGAKARSTVLERPHAWASRVPTR